MPRSAINLEPYKAEIADLYTKNISCDSIIENLSRTHNITISERTLRTRLRGWGIRKQNRTVGTNQVLHARIKQDGFDITARTLLYLRHKLGLYRRIKNPIVEQTQVENVLEQLRAELDRSKVEGLGETLFHTYYQAGVTYWPANIFRDCLYSSYRKVAPAAERRGLQDLQQERGAYVVPGPNYIWSVDGYLKLAPYGTEIYAAIDAYSRYIIWIYVGTTSRTAVSVLRQFLEAVRVIKRQPQIVRSGQGTARKGDDSAILLAEAQHKLQQSRHPETQLSDCYIYGTSTARQQIGAWWDQLTKGLLYRWSTYFQSLQDKETYSKDNLADQIAFHAVYMPVLRLEITSFVRTWNNHPIRLPKKRPHLVSGKQFMNFNYPKDGVLNYGLEFDENLLSSMHEDVRDWDPEEYLPFATYVWTKSQLKELIFDPEDPPKPAEGDGIAPYYTTYLELRDRFSAHISEGKEPELALPSRPVGKLNGEPALIKNISEVEILNDQGAPEDGVE
ncbi:hypothetical protein BDV09DRAFT_202841 [Aspergillus tetrazonus]